jgi:tRNA-methyltransferase O
MGERMRALDWSRTALGPAANWSQALKTAVSIILNSRYAMFVWRGRQLTNLDKRCLPALPRRDEAARVIGERRLKLAAGGGAAHARDYWMHHARRDLVLQTPSGAGHTTGTFALRSPVRPNPIASSIVELVAIDGTTLQVRGLDCLDGTPLIDLKPEHAAAAG